MRFTTPDVQFQIGDGAALTARMSLKAWAALQDHWQLANLDEAVQRLADMEAGRLPALDLAAILWAALRTHHQDVSMDQAITMLDDMGIPNFTLLATRCAAASIPEGSGGHAQPHPLRSLWSRGRSQGSRS